MHNEQTQSEKLKKLNEFFSKTVKLTKLATRAQKLDLLEDEYTDTVSIWDGTNIYFTYRDHL